MLPDELELDEPVPEVVPLEELPRRARARRCGAVDPLVVAKATEVPTPASVPVRSDPGDELFGPQSFILGLRRFLVRGGPRDPAPGGRGRPVKRVNGPE